MRVLVTGGAGFIGSHLSNHLCTQGHEVVVMDNLSTGLASNLSSEVQLIRMDVCGQAGNVFAQLRPEVVVHLAAQVSVPQSVADPMNDLSHNVAGTINVMQAAAEAKARKVIFFSSAAVYGVPGAGPISEEHSTAPVSPYGLSKLTAEHYVRLLGASLGVAYTVIRPANIFGARQRTDSEGAVVPSFLSRFLAGRDPVIHGDGSQTRDFVHVNDVVRAVAQAMTLGDGATLNVSGGHGTSIHELWGLMAQLLGWKRPPCFAPTRAGDIPNSVLANALAQSVLKWRPEVPLEAGLAETIAWTTRAEAAAARQGNQ